MEHNELIQNRGEHSQKGPTSKSWRTWFLVGAGAAIIVGCGSQAYDNYVPLPGNKSPEGGTGGAQSDGGTVWDGSEDSADSSMMNDGATEGDASMQDSGPDAWQESDGSVSDSGSDAADSGVMDASAEMDSGVVDSGLDASDSGICVPITSACSSQNASNTLTPGTYFSLGDNQIELVKTELDYGTPRAIVSVNDSCSTELAIYPVYEGKTTTYVVGGKTYLVNASSIVTGGTQSAIIDANEECSDAGAPDSGAADSGSGGDSGSVSDSGVTDSGVSDSGASDAGMSDAEASDSGSTDSGVTDSGPTDSGFNIDSGVTDGGVCVPLSLVCTDQSNANTLNVGQYITLGDHIVYLTDTQLDYGSPRAIVSFLDSCGNPLNTQPIYNGETKNFVDGTKTYAVTASSIVTTTPKSANLSVAESCPDGGVMDGGSSDGGVVDSGALDGGSDADLDAAVDGDTPDATIIDAGPDASFPCPGASKANDPSGNYPLGTPLTVGGVDFTYTKEISGGITMEYVCHSNSVVLVPSEALMHAATKWYSIGGLTVSVTSNFDTPLSANVAIELN